MGSVAAAPGAADGSADTGARQAAATYLRELLLRPGRFRSTWEQYAERNRPGQINQLAVAEGLMPHGADPGGAKLVYLGRTGPTGVTEREQDPLTP